MWDPNHGWVRAPSPAGVLHSLRDERVHLVHPSPSVVAPPRADLYIQENLIPVTDTKSSQINTETPQTPQNSSRTGFLRSSRAPAALHLLHQPRLFHTSLPKARQTPRWFSSVRSAESLALVFHPCSISSEEQTPFVFTALPGGSFPSKPNPALVRTDLHREQNQVKDAAFSSLLIATYLGPG